MTRIEAEKVLSLIDPEMSPFETKKRLDWFEEIGFFEDPFLGMARAYMEAHSDTPPSTGGDPQPD